MNCANHPERTATAYCQSCGKPLCPECVRAADGLILCEPCLLTRAAAAASAASSTSSNATSRSASGATFGSTSSPGAAGAWQTVAQAGARPGYVPAPGVSAPVSQTSPGLAALLGFIPGVGAMYNGQFVKALLHVIIFIVLIGTTEHLPLVGILIAAWVFYQVFDAAQTAAARRDGHPLPDPFGILDMSQRLGPQHPTYPPTQFQGPPAGIPQQPAQAPQPRYAPQYDPRGQYAGQYPSPPQVPGQVASAVGYPPMQTVPYPLPQRRGEPVGAIVLIAVGLLLLLSTLGVLNVDWIWRGWPVLVLLLGIWLLFRRATAVPAFGPLSPVPSTPVAPNPVPSTPGTVPAAPAAPAGITSAKTVPEEPAPFRRDDPLSITPEPTMPREEEVR